MPPLRNIGLVEMLIILAILILLFGVGRISKVGKELGTAISEFRREISEGNEEGKTTEPETTEEA